MITSLIKQPYQGVSDSYIISSANIKYSDHHTQKLIKRNTPHPKSRLGSLRDSARPLPVEWRLAQGWLPAHPRPPAVQHGVLKQRSRVTKLRYTPCDGTVKPKPV